MKFYIKQPSSGVEHLFIKEFCSDIFNMVEHGYHVEILARLVNEETGLALFHTFAKCVSVCCFFDHESSKYDLHIVCSDENNSMTISNVGKFIKKWVDQDGCPLYVFSANNMEFFFKCAVQNC